MSVLQSLSTFFSRIFGRGASSSAAPPEVSPPLQAPQAPVAVQALTAIAAPLTNAQSSALLAVWAVTGSRVTTFQAGTQLWHGGTIASSNDLDNTKAIWCTYAQANASDYDNWAIGDAQRKGVTAHRLTLELRRPLKIADFGRASLNSFTQKHCNFNHDAMKAALRAWCLSQGFDGVVNLNGDPFEFVVCQPADALSILSSVQLWP